MGETVWQDNWGPRMESALRFAILALTESNEHLARENPERQLTIADIDAVLTLNQFRDGLLGLYVEDWQTTRWFEGYYRGLSPQKKEDVINPVQTKIHRLIGSDVVYHVLGQSQSTFSFDEIVQGNKIVLANLDAGAITPRNTALLGTMFLSYLQLAVRRQDYRNNNARMAIIVDEFQQIPFDYKNLLAELQKFGASFTIGTQSLAQLDAVDPNLRGALLGNIDTLISFQVSALDAKPLVPEFDENNLTISDFTRLQEYRCYVRTLRKGMVTSPFLIKTRPLPELDIEIEAKIRSFLPQYTHPVPDVKKMLKTHQKYWYRKEYKAYEKSAAEQAALRQLRDESDALIEAEDKKVEATPLGTVGSFEIGDAPIDEIPFDAGQKNKRTRRKRKETKEN